MNFTKLYQKLLISIDKEIGSLKVVVEDTATGEPISAASVRVQNGTLGYDVTGTTDQFGWAYFPEDATPLATESYDVTVSASGYGNESETVAIDGALVTETIELTAN
jgi:hypothetical protein